MNRYARQMLLPDVGSDGQARLARAEIAVIGAGGLGCPVLQYLAGAGVGRITLLDPDCVEETNLHRQPLYRMTDLGRPKVEAARDFVQSLNPDIDIRSQVGAFNPDSAPDIVNTADVVIDAADSFAVSYTLSDVCLSAGKPLISASVLGQSGYVGGFCGPAPSLRAVFPELPISGATCATAGVLGPVVGVVGALQAQMALRIVLASKPSPLGRMVTLDLANLRFGGFSFLGNPEPKSIFPFLAKNMLQTSDLVVELRDRSEASQPIVPTATRMGKEEVIALSPEPGQRVVLCCGSGLRAWQAASALHAHGYENLALLAAKACA